MCFIIVQRDDSSNNYFNMSLLYDVGQDNTLPWLYSLIYYRDIQRVQWTYQLDFSSSDVSKYTVDICVYIYIYMNMLDYCKLPSCLKINNLAGMKEIKLMNLF